MTMHAASPRFARERSLRVPHAGLKAAALLLVLGASMLGFAQDAKPADVQTSAPIKVTHVVRPATSIPPGSSLRRQVNQQTLEHTNLTPVKTGSGVVYTCDASVAASTCTYLNTTVAGYYNSIFTNANADIYVQYGATGLGESEGYINLVPYSHYLSAITSTTPKSSIQASALSSINTYAATPYSGGNLEVTVALGTTLGMTGLTGITPTTAPCTPGTAGCYNEIVTVANAATQEEEGFTLYYDDQGGTETADQYDFYAVVQHETDEVLGTSSCISTSNPLSDGCGSGVPSAVDLMRYSSPGTLALDTAPSQTAGQYFSYNGGVNYGAIGRDATPTAKVYNTIANGEDFADYTSSSPDCGTNEAIQDATGCPGEDAGMTVLNDGQSEITILNALGFSTPEAAITSPAPGTKLNGSSATFSWGAVTGATDYWVYVGTTGVGSSNIFVNSAEITATSQTVTGLPTSGTVYVRVYSLINGEFWTSTDFTYTGGTGSSSTPATMTSPASGSTLTSSSATFSWTAGSGVTEYDLHVGTTGAGSSNIFGGTVSGQTKTVTGIPTTGGTLNVRLYSLINGAWQYIDYTYTEASPAAKATMSSPTPSSKLTSSSVTFSWTTGSLVTEYDLHVGTTGAGSSNIFAGTVSGTSKSITGIPTTGGTLNVRLYSLIAGAWQYIDYTYTEASPAAPATMSSPTPSTTLTGSSATFTWTAGSLVTEYDLHVGTTGAGSSNIFGGTVAGQTKTVTGIPTTGGTLNVRLYSLISGAWQYVDYTYTEQ